MVLEAVVVILELGLLIVLIIRVRRLRSIYRDEKALQPYPLDAFRLALEGTVGRRVGGLLFSEISVLWYAFAGWKGARTSHPAGSVFPGYRRNGYPAILGAVLMAVVVETAGVHFLLSLWIGAWAWIPTGLGIYSIAWLIGDLHAARLNPSLSTEQGLHLRTGLRWRIDLPWADLHQVCDTPPDGPVVGMTLFGKPDVWLECRDEVQVEGPFGILRQGRFLGLGLDAPERFAKEVRVRTAGADDPGIDADPA